MQSNNNISDTIYHNDKCDGRFITIHNLTILFIQIMCFVSEINSLYFSYLDFISNRFNRQPHNSEKYIPKILE